MRLLDFDSAWLDFEEVFLWLSPLFQQKKKMLLLCIGLQIDIVCICAQKFVWFSSETLSFIGRKKQKKMVLYSEAKERFDVKVANHIPRVQ